MMLIPDQGKIRSVEEVYRSSGAREPFLLSLFTAPQAAGNLLTYWDYTLASGGGLDPLSIARSSFEPAVIVGEVAQLLRLPPPSWTKTSGAPVTVYGWILSGETSQIVYAAQTFVVPHEFVVGATLTLSPFKIDCAQITD
jgi:hypothetical protein